VFFLSAPMQSLSTLNVVAFFRLKRRAFVEIDTYVKINITDLH
jgi:hypothetical protein